MPVDLPPSFDFSFSQKSLPSKVWRKTVTDCEPGVNLRGCISTGSRAMVFVNFLDTIGTFVRFTEIG